MKAILAADDNFGIGKDNSLPWTFPEDMKFFRFMTIGSTVVMGRNTYESCGPLKWRRNIVISSTLKSNGNIRVCKDLDDALFTTLNVFIIGGAKLIESAWSYIDELFLTRIPGSYECDSFINIPEYMIVKSKMNISDDLVVEKYINKAFL